MTATHSQESTQRTPYALNRPLPAEVVAGQGVWLGYRRYPTFSARWLRGRQFMFGLCTAAFTLLVAAGQAMATADRSIVVYSALHFFVGFMLICGAGPVLATLVRHAGMSVRRERIAVVVALIVGIVVAFFADQWASSYLESVLPKAQGIEVKLKPPSYSPLEKAGLAALKLSFAILIYGALGGGLALRAYFRELGRWQDVRQAEAMRELQADKQRADMRLSVLQAQIEPHFLFNTLASVRAMARKDPEQVEATLDALVNYLRAGIPRLRDGDVAVASTLGQQLDLCASYLDVMRIRTAGRLQYTIAADADVRALGFPPLLLITLVENAIKHGIEPKPGPGQIAISAKRDGDMLQVTVADDGKGLQPGVGGGLGLVNLRAQLETLYAGRAAFDLRSDPAGGACAELRLPVSVRV